MVHRYLAVLPILFLLSGCSRSKDSKAPPSQQGMVRRKQMAPTKSVVFMNDPAALDYVVRDVSDALEGNRWRWTFEHPELQFVLKSTEKLKFEADYSVADATLKDTGPVTVTFSVNGHDLPPVKHAKTGDYKFSQPVPAAWLSTDGFTKVGIDVKPLWVAPSDGKKLGLILIRAGFVSE
jgi:hypothetical protein